MNPGCDLKFPGRASRSAHAAQCKKCISMSNKIFKPLEPAAKRTRLASPSLEHPPVLEFNENLAGPDILGAPEV